MYNYIFIPIKVAVNFIKSILWTGLVVAVDDVQKSIGKYQTRYIDNNNKMINQTVTNIFSIIFHDIFIET